MKKPSRKERTCKYNTNRDSADIAYPYCTWAENIIRIINPMPPHIGLVSEAVEHIDCRRCKAYEEFNKNQKVD